MGNLPMVQWALTSESCKLETPPIPLVSLRYSTKATTENDGSSIPNAYKSCRDEEDALQSPVGH